MATDGSRVKVGPDLCFCSLDTAHGTDADRRNC
jgi:hypothetical protein